MKFYQVGLYEKVVIRYTCLVLLIFIVHCDAVDMEVEGGMETHLAQQIASSSNQNNSLNGKSGELDSNLGASKEAVKNIILDKNNSSKEIEPKEAQIGQNISFNNDTKEAAEKGKVDKGTEPEEVILPSTRKENSRSEECDSSNQCKDDTNALVACLRVPGNDSPEFSLLVQNKGKVPLNVTISAPNFVWLENSQLQLLENDNVKVKVSIRNGGSDDLIILKAGDGNCTLELRNVVAHNSIRGSDNTSQSTYINLLNRSPFVFLFVALVIIMGSILISLGFRRMQLSSNNSSPRYEKLDLELPVSGGPKIDNMDLNDGWDNSWNDSWDDEEAPSMPVTPSLSSPGVSSRHIKKDGWKD